MKGGTTVDAKKYLQAGFYLMLAGAFFLGALLFAQKGKV
jgi:hypothetical protein